MCYAALLAFLMFLKQILTEKFSNISQLPHFLLFSRMTSKRRFAVLILFTELFLVNHPLVDLVRFSLLDNNFKNFDRTFHKSKVSKVDS